VNWKTLALGVLLAAGTAGAAGTNGTAYPFFPFCIDWHDANHRTFEEQAPMLKELGYDGVGHLWLDRVDERIQSLDAQGLKLFQISIKVNIAPGQEPYDRRFTNVLALVMGRGVQFCVLMDGMKPSDPAGDARGVEILRQMSDEARAAGADLLLYPHAAMWLETIGDAMRVAGQVDRTNVNVMFNLCHWLRADKQRDYKQLLQQAMPRLHAVSICGADITKKEPAWTADYILTLDAGTFDVGAFLKTLKEVGYRGPIGLQCYGIGGDERVTLTRSMNGWQKLKKNLED